MGNGKHQRRVVVTGMGMVSPLGTDVETSWRSAIEGRSGVTAVTRFDASAYDSRIAAEVKGFEPEQYIPAKEIRRMDRFIHYAIAVCKQAAFQANLTIDDTNANDIGVLMGWGIGGIETLTEAVLTLDQKGPGKVRRLTIAALRTDLAAGHSSMR